jgi:hypothetical protein
MKKMMIRILAMLTMWVTALFTKAHDPRWFLPVITANGPTTFCAGGSVTLTSSPGVSYLWSSGETTQSITVTTSGNYTVTVTYANSNSETSAATTVTVNPAPFIISTTVSPATICAGSIANLNVNVQGASGNSNYNLTSIPFAPVIPAGPVTVLATGGVAVTPMSINNLDDGTWDNIPLPSGFAFKYYGTTPTTFSVSTNGFMTFGPTGGSYCCFGQLLPNTGSPNNYIAMAHEDWALSTSGTMDYFVNGVAPFRKFVLRAIAVPHFGNSGAPTTAMVVLNETYNTIEMHLTSVTSGPSDFTTQAIENSTGTLFTVVQDRNRTVWSASNEGWLFSPPVYSYVWTPTTGLNNASINNPVSSAATSTTYSVTVTNNNTGCSTTSAPVTLTVNPADHFVCPPDMNETITDISCSKSVNTANPVFCTLPEKLIWKLTGATMMNSPASGINYVGLRKMNVGVTTVTYTATFQDATVKTCSFNITVKETIPPEISCPPDIHVNTDPGKCYRTSPVSLGNPKTSDNCGVASVINNAPPIYIKGVNFVTWTITDKSGNTRTCVQRVTVDDVEKPMITCPANMNVNTGADCDATTITTPHPVFIDNCGIASLTWAMVGVSFGSSPNTGINFVPTMNYATGLSRITYSAVDLSGNAMSCTFNVLVTDNTPPLLTCPPEQTLCKVPYNIYTIPSLMQADNCGILSSSYKVTGATNRIGGGTNASGIFYQGVSTITWTVKDVNGNSSTCTTKVTVLPNTNSNCSPAPGLLLTAWPNPSNNYFNLKVQSTTKEMIEIRMIDMSGKLVQTKKGGYGDTYILGDNVVSGMYIIEVMQAGKTARTKVIKN